MEISAQKMKAIPEGEEQLSFYLNKPNKKGWGVIYLRLRIGDKVVRLSTYIKVKAKFWSSREGRIIIPYVISNLDRAIHLKAESELINVKDIVISNLFWYFCNVQKNSGLTTSINEVINNVKFQINLKMEKTISKRTPSVTMAFRSLLEEKSTNPKSLSTHNGIISNFATFLKTKGLEDTMDVISQSTLKKYKRWLLDERKLGSSRVSNSINLICRLCHFIEERDDVDFKLNVVALRCDIRDVRSADERRKNKVALTEDEILKLRDLNLDGKEKVVRDIFLLQCYCGFRFEDLSQFLDSNNLKVIDGISYSVFNPQKCGECSIPLNHQSYYPEAYEIFKLYENKSPFSDSNSHNKRFNEVLKKIARMANLDREVVVTKGNGGQKTTQTRKVYEILTSHCGRHTFATNCARYKNIPKEVLKNITGHASTDMLDKVYCNLEAEDITNAVHNVGNVLTSNNKTHYELESNKKASKLNNYLIEGIEEARNVLKFLGVDYDDSLDFEDLINLIEKKHFEIVDNFGVSIRLLKDIYCLSMPISLRIKCLRSLNDTISLACNV